MASSGISGAHIPALQQAPTMMHYLSKPPIQTAPGIRPNIRPLKQGRRKSQHKHIKSELASEFQSVKPNKSQPPEDR